MSFEFLAQATVAAHDGYYVPGVVLTLIGAGIGTAFAAVGTAIGIMYKRQSDDSIAREHRADELLRRKDAEQRTERGERTSQDRKAWETIQALSLELAKTQEAQREAANDVEELTLRISELTADQPPPSRASRPHKPRRSDSR